VAGIVSLALMDEDLPGARLPCVRYCPSGKDFLIHHTLAIGFILYGCCQQSFFFVDRLLPIDSKIKK